MKQTNLDYYLGEIAGLLTNGENQACENSNILGINCDDYDLCKDCPAKNKDSLVIWFHQEYKPQPIIELKAWEYDLLKEWESVCIRFEYSAVLSSMKERGYFQGITDTSMLINDILKYAKVVL